MLSFRRISSRVILIVFIVLTVSLGTVLFFQIRNATELHLKQAIQKARALTTFCEQSRQFMGELRSARMFDDAMLMESYARDKESGKGYSETKIYLTIPVVAAWTTAEKKAEELGYQFRVPKNQPRNNKNQPRPGLEQSVVDYLEGRGSVEAITKAGGKIIYPEKATDAVQLGEIGVIQTGREAAAGSGSETQKIDAVRFFRAIRLSEDCLACHGDPKGESDFLGFAKEGWRVGEVHGAFEIISPLAGLRSDVRGMVRASILVMILVLSLASAIFYFFLRNIISRPLREVGIFTRKFGNGDLTADIPIHSKDEIGEMTADLMESVVNLREMVTGLSASTVQLSTASDGLSAISVSMSDSAGKMRRQSDSVAGAAELVASNVETVAAAGEQSSSVVSNIAAMTEEMSSTVLNIAEVARDVSLRVEAMAGMGRDMSSAINRVSLVFEEVTASFREVEKNTSKADSISKNAAQRAEEVNTGMIRLVDASRQIGKVVGIIKDIADQTNLLALNAAIEAAGAGEAGKGFAVVANEVKALARQSADATDEITERIAEIQNSTEASVQAIVQIGEIINDIANINETIAANVREQTNASAGIFRDVTENAAMAERVAGTAHEVSKLVNDIARATGEASQAAVEVARNVEETAGGIRDVARALWGSFNRSERNNPEHSGYHESRGNNRRAGGTGEPLFTGTV